MTENPGTLKGFPFEEIYLLDNQQFHLPGPFSAQQMVFLEPKARAMAREERAGSQLSPASPLPKDIIAPWGQALTFPGSAMLHCLFTRLEALQSFNETQATDKMATR